MSCQSCQSLISVVTLLQNTIDKQQKLLMAFNRAGLHLAQHEEAMAKLDIRKRENEVQAMQATAELHRAEARKIEATETGPIPRFGVKGHERTYVGTPVPATI